MKPTGGLSGVLIFLVCSLSDVFGEETTCAQKTCVEGAFKYVAGRTYRYAYSTQITTILPNQPEARTFRLNLTAEISIVSACSHRLAVKLNEVSDQNAAFPADSVRLLRENLQKKPLDFAFYNGKIGEICFDPEEVSMALNIKKGILSAFQVSATTSTGFTKGTFLEVDIAGECPTVYTLNDGEDNQVHLNKRRSVTDCNDRKTQTPELLQTSLGSAVQSLLQSDPSCQHLIRDGVLRSANCEERHSLKPFPSQAKTLLVRVSQQLTFLEENQSAQQRKNQNRQLTGTLRFALEDTPEPEETSLKEKLEALCTVAKNDVRPETPSFFSKLVDGLREEMNCTVVDSLFDQLRDATVCSYLTEAQRDQIIHDTVPAVGSVCSIKFMSQLLQDGGVDFSKAELWFVSLAFIRDPTKDMLEALLPLVGNTDLPRSGYLGISTLTRNYCLFNSAECDTTLVSAFEVSILKNLNPTCEENADDKPNQDKTITYIKAVGNLGPSPYAMDVLQLILQCKLKPLAVRLTAIEAFRRRDCNEVSPKTMGLSTILEDTTEDTELRVSAYRTLMVCPDDSMIRMALDLYLNTEEHPQLRQYIGSQLKNLNESTGASHAAVREALSTFPTITQINSNGYMTSRNFLYEAGDGGRMSVVEGNVLFTNSFLPKSADLGFGVELFGRRLDLLQIGGRVEGFEETVERMMGPSGHFSERTLKDGVMSLLFGSESKEVDRTLLSNQMKKQRDQFNFKENDGNFLAYFRMFGNDLSFATLNDLLVATDSFLKNSVGVFDFLFGRSEEKPFDISRNVELLDGTYRIESASGLPLNLKLAATASGKLSGKTRMNIAGLFGRDAPFSFEAEISPSLAVRVAATFRMDLKAISTGFSTVWTLHSSTDLSGSAEFRNGHFVRTKLNLPKEKMEFVTFESKSYGIRGAEQRLIVSDPAVSIHRALSECTAPLTSRLFGVEFCAELDSQDPLNSTSKRDGLLPASFRLFLRKTDPDMTGYKFELEYPTGDSFRVLFDTPGSRISRHFQVSYALNRVNRTLSGVFATPWKQYDLDGQFSPPSGIRLELIEDKVRPFRFLFSSAGRMVDADFNLQPEVTLVTPFWDPIEIAGSINWKPSGPMDIRADLNLKWQMLTGRLLLTQKGQETSVVTVQYRLSRAARVQEILLNYKNRFFPTARNDLLKTMTTASVEFTEFPLLNTLVQSELLWSPENLLSHVESTLSVYPRNFQDENNKIVVRSLLSAKKLAGRWNVTTGLSVLRGPTGFSLAHTQEWDSALKFFEGRVSTQGVLGRKSLRVAWDNKFATAEHRLTVEADASADSSADLKFLNFRGTLRDESAFLSRSYPFEMALRSSEFRSLRLSGEFSGTRSDVGLDLDVHRDEEPYLTSTHSVSWKPWAISSQYQLSGQQSGHVDAGVYSPTDWTVRTNWTEGSVQWTSVVGVLPQKGHGYSVLALLTREHGLPAFAGRYQKLKFGVDLEFFQNPEVQPVDVRTSFTIFTGITSHAARSVLQVDLAPSRKRVLSLVDIAINAASPLPLMFVSHAEAVMTALSCNGTVNVVQNFTSRGPSYIRTEFRKQVDNRGHELFFQLQNDPKGRALIAIGVKMERDSAANRSIVTVTAATAFAGLRSAELVSTMEKSAKNWKLVHIKLTRNAALVLNATGTRVQQPDTRGCVAYWTVQVPGLQTDDIRVESSKSYLEGATIYTLKVTPSTHGDNGSFGLSLTFTSSQKKLTLWIPKRTVTGVWSTLENQQNIEVAWDAEKKDEKRIRLSRSATGTAGTTSGHWESWSLLHPRLSAPITVNMQYATNPEPTVLLGMKDGKVLRAVPRFSSDFAQLRLLYQPSSETQFPLNSTTFEASHEITGRFADDDTFELKANKANQSSLLTYRTVLQENRNLVQTATWNSDALKTWKDFLNLSADQLVAKLKDLSSYSAAELRTILAEVKSYEFFRNALQVGRASATNVALPVAVPVRYRRNAFAMAGATGGCGSGAIAMAGASGSYQCGSSGADFSAVASSVHSQISQMMQDMVSKFQNRPQPQPQSRTHYSSGVIHVNIAEQAASPCSSSQQASSYGGCVPAPAPAPYPISQTHRIEIKVSGGQSPPAYQAPAPSPCSAAPSSPCGSSSPSYQQQPQQQPQQPAYRQSSYQQSSYAAAGSVGYPGYSSPSAASYSTSIVAQPSYGPVDAYQSPPAYAPLPPQGSQYHASQKSAAASSPSQSFTVPIGNTKLTIQVYHQGEEPAPAPQPQSSAQYVASGSSQSQYAIAGQIPYGGGAEPRLQYCTPGSTEKGVCLNGVDSLEPTRSKRSVEVIGETFRVHVQSYLQVAKKTAENAWNTFLTQPEVQYLLNVAERVFEHTAIKIQSNLSTFQSQSSSNGRVLDQLRAFTPKVTTFLTETFGGVTVEQLLPFPLASLRKPLPKTLSASSAAGWVLPSPVQLLPTGPSFHGTAKLVDGKTISTFGGVTFDLQPVPCRYVFAHDFDDGNFTVILGFDFFPAGTSNVQLTEVEVVGRMSSYKLNVSGSFPVIAKEFPDFFVASFADYVGIISHDGWTVTYETTPERKLTLIVNGLYSSKVAGLAGSFDMSPRSDFMIPDRTMLKRNQLGLFVDTWQWDETCPSGSTGR